MSDNTKPYDTLWAILSQDKNGNEGICALNGPLGPQVAVTGEKRILQMYLEEIMRGQDQANAFKMKIILAEYKRTKSKELIK